MGRLERGDGTAPVTRPTAEVRARALGDLVAATHLMTWEQLPGAVASCAARAGWPGMLIYLADLQQERLYLVAADDPDGGAAPADPLPVDPVPTDLAIDGTVAGRAFQRGEVCAASSAVPGRWWVPLLNGTERMGVLRVGGPGTPVEADEDLGILAGLVAMLIVSKRSTSDGYAQLVRRRRMKVTAEMEWRLMPPRTLATDRMLLSAVMEPAYEISGDAFDYAPSRDAVHLALFDAMGHDTAAGLTANLAVAACRNQRRVGASMPETVRGIEHVLAEQFEGARYATGVLAHLDLSCGELTWTALGHPAPVIIRGGRTALHLDCPPAPPMGTCLGLPPTVCRTQLEPGDRLVLYTDGITEARNRDGREFGLDRLVDFLVRHHADALPVPETLRRLIRHHLEYHHGRLGDDATLMLLEWHGPTPYPPATLRALAGLPPSATSAEPLAALSGPPPAVRRGDEAGTPGEAEPAGGTAAP